MKKNHILYNACSLLLNLRIFSQEGEDEIYSLSQSISFDGVIQYH